ncbi:enoyl-CoA hydratase/isomerase family protein [Corynebacterium sp. A21]|uniref:enoyl-CoA hydratase/isomerase family protein n=1 Tax=Corynebacterium sp. A21 TaxID=3457318 RepID=UPI003FD5FBD2
MTENTRPESTVADAEVRAYIRGGTGILELNRPRAINSLNPAMIREITQALTTWQDDEEITQVLVFSNSERGFCAGGDVRFARDSILADDHAAVDAFFREEYSLNHLIAKYPKPYVALIDGVVMGGGLGISLHGSHRVITEKTFAAMPEMAIGYFTDVGVAYAAQRMVGKKGQPSEAIAAFIGITGARLSPADMLWCGVATDIISSKSLQNFMDAMIERGISAALKENAIADPKDSELAGYAIEIEECFGQLTWADIDEALEEQPKTDFSEKVRGLMAGANPTSVVATTEFFTACRSARGLREALDKEVALGEVLRREPNFVEGVRAVLVDKDRNAAFEPATIAEVDVEKYRAILS